MEIGLCGAAPNFVRCPSHQALQQRKARSEADEAVCACGPPESTFCVTMNDATGIGLPRRSAQRPIDVACQCPRTAGPGWGIGKWHASMGSVHAAPRACFAPKLLPVEHQLFQKQQRLQHAYVTSDLQDTHVLGAPPEAMQPPPLTNTHTSSSFRTAAPPGDTIGAQQRHLKPQPARPCPQTPVSVKNAAASRGLGSAPLALHHIGCDLGTPPQRLRT